MNEITLDTKIAKTTIDRNIYGHFAEHLGRCIYEGVWVGEDSSIPNVRGIRKDVVAALRNIKIPVLRWPGGCFADEYHWKDGVGPKADRPAMVNTHWGGVVEPYICGNVGSGTVQEMSQWVEYLTFDGKSPMANWRAANGQADPWKIKYFGVGNENWGCGGRMTAEYYADQYRNFAVYCRNYGDNKLYRIACGPRNEDYHWTEVMMDKAGNEKLMNAPYMDGLALHYYTNLERLPDGNRRGSATQFDEAQWIEIVAKGLYMDTLVRRHSTIMDKYDPQKKVAMIVDEWGTWYAPEPGTHPRFLYQQNTMRDAIVAATSLDIFNKYADRVRMANIAQTINVLQAMILTDKEKMILTPSYHVFEMYAAHQDATLVPVDVQSERYALAGYDVPAISVSASVAANGKLHITLSNANPNKDIPVNLFIRGMKAQHLSARVLQGDAMNAHNTFEQPNRVTPQPFNGVKPSADGLEIVMPKMSVVAVEVG